MGQRCAINRVKIIVDLFTCVPRAVRALRGEGLLQFEVFQTCTIRTGFVLATRVNLSHERAHLGIVYMFIHGMKK